MMIMADGDDGDDGIHPGEGKVALHQVGALPGGLPVGEGRVLGVHPARPPGQRTLHASIQSSFCPLSAWHLCAMMRGLKVGRPSRPYRAGSV